MMSHQCGYSLLDISNLRRQINNIYCSVSKNTKCLNDVLHCTKSERCLSFLTEQYDRLVIIDISMVNPTNIIVESQVKQINKEQHTSVSSAEDRLQICFPEQR